MFRTYLILIVICINLYIASSFLIDQKQTISNQQIKYQPLFDQNKNRLLQIVIDTDKEVEQKLNKIILDTNNYRQNNNIQKLTVNNNVNTLLRTWYRTLKPVFPLRDYLQLYSIFYTQTYYFERIPINYISQVINKLAEKLKGKTHNQIAYHYKKQNNNQYEIYILLIGGGQQQKRNDFNKAIIDKQIKEIQERINSQIQNKEQQIINLKSENIQTKNQTQSSNSSINDKQKPVINTSNNQGILTNPTSNNQVITSTSISNNSGSATPSIQKRNIQSSNQNSKNQISNNIPLKTIETSTFIINNQRSNNISINTTSQNNQGLNTNIINIPQNQSNTTNTQSSITTPSNNNNNQPVNNPPPVINQPVNNPPPVINQPVNNSPPVINQSVSNPMSNPTSVINQPVNNPPPVINQSVNNPPPVINQPVSNPTSTANNQASNLTPSSLINQFSNINSTRNTSTSTITSNIQGQNIITTRTTQNSNTSNNQVNTTTTRITSISTSNIQSQTSNRTSQTLTPINQFSTILPSRNSQISQQNLRSIPVLTQIPNVTNRSSNIPITVQNVPISNNPRPILVPSSLNNLPLISQTNFPITPTLDTSIVLTHSIPQTFVKDEIFAFKGYLTNPISTGITRVNVIFNRVNDNRRLAFSQIIKANQRNFTIYATLNITGTFYISLFRGAMGRTYQNTYTVEPRFIKQIVSRSPPTLRSAQLNLIGNKLFVNWTHSGQIKPALTKIRFSQDKNILSEVELLISNYQSSFQIPYARFSNFAKGPTSIQLSQAYSSRQGANFRTSDFSAPYNIVFNAVQHNYEQIKGNNFNNFSLRQPANSILTLQGRNQQVLLNEILLQSPKRNFVSFYINNKTQKSTRIPIQTNINVDVKLQQEGVYILEVNEAGGSAVINVPLYVGDVYPLIPDFLDLSPEFSDSQSLNQPLLLQERRFIVLTLINNIRRLFGSNPVVLDDKLNNLAQNYSNVLVQTNTLSHTDSQGRSPNDRAVIAGINEGVGQNLAFNSNLTQAQLMLQRSPIHLRNMINPIWVRVGLGIAQNANQNYILVQQFSSRDLKLNPLTDEEKRTIQRQVARFILTKNPQLRRQNQALSSQLQNYNNLQNKPSILSYLRQFGYSAIGVQNINVNYNNGNYIQLLQNGRFFVPRQIYTEFGVSALYVNSNKNFIEIYVAYV